MSLFLPCIFYFVAEIRKTWYKKKQKTKPLKPIHWQRNEVLDSCLLNHSEWLVPDLMLGSSIFIKQREVGSFKMTCARSYA